MGKERFKKRSRPEPMSPVKLIDATQSEETETSKSVDEILTKLQSATSSDRASTACVIANLASDPATRHVVMNVDIVRAAAPLILNKSVHVRHCVSGCLRDMSSWGEEACELLLKSDVLTPIAALLRSFSTCDWSKLEQSQGAILLDVLNVLGNVCESSERAVEIFNREHFIELLYPMLALQVSQSCKVPLAAGQCLLAVTENNESLAQRLQVDSQILFTILQDPMDAPANVLLKAFAAGILCNVRAPSSDVSLILKTIKSSLERGLAEPIASVSEKIARTLEIQKRRDLDVENMESLEKELELAIGELDNVLQAKRVSLELLANLCCSDDDEDEWEDDDEEDSTSTSEMETGEVAGETQQFGGCLESAQLLPVIMNHVDALDDGVASIFKGYKSSKRLPLDVHEIRCRSLFCIDDLAQNAPLESLGGSGQVVEIWTKILRILFDAKAKNDPEMVEAATSACRSLLDCLVRSKDCVEKRPEVNTDDMAKLCAIALESEEPAVKVNIAKCTAFLASLIKDRQLVVGTTEFLLQMALQESDLRVCSEAIDSVIDVFGEDDTDSVAAEIGVVGELRKVLPRFKAMLKAAPKSETRMIASTCHLNLGRFIKYKEKRLA